MIASEVIKHYEAYCLRNYPWSEYCGFTGRHFAKDIHKVMVALDIREQTVAGAIAHGGGLDYQSSHPFSSPLRICSRSGLKSDLY